MAHLTGARTNGEGFHRDRGLRCRFVLAFPAWILVDQKIEKLFSEKSEKPFTIRRDCAIILPLSTRGTAG